MESIRQYVLSVICIVIACSVVQMLFASGTSSSYMKMICGFIVTVVVLSPLMKDRMMQWDLLPRKILSEGESAAADGVSDAQEAQKQIIKERTRAYILTKAKDMGAELCVEIQLQEEYPNIPNAVTVSGSFSPYVRRQLSEYMQAELGIAEENQIWMS